MSMPFIDLAAQQRRIRDKIDAAVARVLDSGAYVMGPQIAQLEGQLTQLRTNEAAQKQQADEAAARIVKGPLNMGLGSLFDAKSTTDMAYADATKKRLEETRAQIRQVNAQIDGLKVKVIESDADAMLNYLSTTGINRVLRAGWQG